MNEIHRALATFGLEPGASADSIRQKYKMLIMAWHPDRFPAESGKQGAEAELKKINNANDVLKKHFISGHRATGCECQNPQPASSKDSGSKEPGGGSGSHSNSEDAEAKAKRRDEERRTRTTSESAKTGSEEQAPESDEPSQPQYTEAQKQQDQLRMSRMRWQVARVQAAVFIVICALGSLGHTFKESWHGLISRWGQDRPTQHEVAPCPTNIELNNVTAAPPPALTPLLPNGVARPIDNSKVPWPNH